MKKEQPVDQSDYGVQLRREWVADLYLKGFTTVGIWNRYRKEYGLSRHSLEKDITVVRNELALSEDSFEQMIKDQLLVLKTVSDNAMITGDTNTVLKSQKQITEVLKMVNPNRGVGKSVNVNFNTQNNNVQLPSMSIDEIKDLLGKGDKVINLDENGNI